MASSKSAPLTYTIGTAALSAAATIQQDTYTLTKAVNDDTMGKILLDATQGNYGDSNTAFVTVYEGYKFVSLTVGDSVYSYTAADSTSYNYYELGFTIPASSATVTATFEPITYSVTIVQPAKGGSIEMVRGVTNDSTAYLDTAYFSFITETGYEFDSLIVYYTEGDENEDTTFFPTFLSGTYYGFVMPAHDVKVSGAISADNNPIFYLDMTSDYGTVTGPSTGTSGDSVTLTITPTPGYELTSLANSDGMIDISNAVLNDDGETYSLKFLMPGYATTVYSYFGLKTYALSYTTNVYGTITGPDSVTYLDTVTVTGVANTGYKLVSFTMTTSEGSSTLEATVGEDGYTYTAKFAMPYSDVAIEAVYSIDSYDITLQPTPESAGTLSYVFLESGEDVEYNTKVYLTIETNSGYQLDSLKVIRNSDGDTVAVTFTNSVMCYFMMTDDDVTVVGYYDQTKYAITYNENSYGTFDGPSESPVGDTVTFEVTPVSGYKLNLLQYNGDPLDYSVVNEDTTLYTISFVMPAAAVKIASSFEARTYKFTYETSEGGSFTTAPDTAVYATSATIVAEAAEGYELESLTLNGEAATSVTETVADSVYTVKLTMPASDVAVAASFIKSTYTISIDEEVEGVTLSLAGESSVIFGETVKVAAVVAAGYTLQNVYYTNDDGDKVEATLNGAYYEFTMPASDVVVSATMSAGSYTITYVSYSGGGSITGTGADGSFITAGETVEITLTAETGYELVALYVGLEEIEYEDNGDGTYTAYLTMPGQATQVTATFDEKTYTVTYATVENGTVTGDLSAAYNATVAFENEPSEGYALSYVTITYTDPETSEEVSKTVTGTSFTMPAANVTVTGTFAAQSYKVTTTILTGSAYGELSVESPQEYNSTVTVTATALYGYELYNLALNTGDVIEFTETDEEGVFTGTFTMPAEPVTVLANFGIRSYSIA